MYVYLRRSFIDMMDVCSWQSAFKFQKLTLTMEHKCQLADQCYVNEYSVTNLIFSVSGFLENSDLRLLQGITFESKIFNWRFLRL